MTTPTTPTGDAAERVHELKTWPRFFAKVLDGSKTFEMRRDDRGFGVGDELHLREWSPASDGYYTGRELRVRISYILREHDGVVPGFAVLGLATPPQPDAVVSLAEMRDDLICTITEAADVIDGAAMVADAILARGYRRGAPPAGPEVEEAELSRQVDSRLAKHPRERGENLMPPPPAGPAVTEEMVERACAVLLGKHWTPEDGRYRGFHVGWRNRVTRALAAALERGEGARS